MTSNAPTTDPTSMDLILINGVPVTRDLIHGDFVLAAASAAAKARVLRKTNHFKLMGRWVPHPELEGCPVCGAMIDPSEHATPATLSANDGPAVAICEACAAKLAAACDG